MSVTQKEIVQALTYVGCSSRAQAQHELAMRIESEGIAPPSVDALIAELDALLKPNSEWVGNMDNVYINYYALKAVCDKYRSAK